VNLSFSFLEFAGILWDRFVLIPLLVLCSESDVLFIFLDPAEVLAENLRRLGFDKGLGVRGICSR
jgi:hypothetical protein